MAKLDALERSIGGNVADSLTPQSETTPQSGPGLPERLRGITKAKNAANIPVTKIVADSDQPRETFEEEGLQLLAKSIGTHGILQPLLVRWCDEHSYYILISGERRWRAAQLAGLQTLPCIIREGDLDSGARLTLQIIENEMREAIAPLELARGYRRLMDLQNWSAGQLSEQLHIPKSTITRTLELLDLPSEVQVQVDRGEIRPSVAAEIGRLPDKYAQAALAERVISENMTRAAVVEEVRAKRPPRTPIPTDPKSTSKPDPQLEVTQVEITLGRGRAVLVSGVPAGAGPEGTLEILYLAIDKLKTQIAG